MMNKRLILYHIVEKMWLSMREKLLKEFLFDDVVACKYRILHAFLSFFTDTTPPPPPSVCCFVQEEREYNG